MKFLVLSSVIGLLSIFYNFSPSFLNEESILHHTCSCTASMGGTAEATCTDTQNCTCSSGFFSCSCKCSNPSAPPKGGETPINTGGTDSSYKLDKLPKESDWTMIENILKKEQNPIAKKLLSSMKGVFSLASRNPDAFLQKTIELERIYQSLPTSIQSKLERAVN